jgi:hypothetical protein
VRDGARAVPQGADLDLQRPFSAPCRCGECSESFVAATVEQDDLVAGMETTGVLKVPSLTLTEGYDARLKIVDEEARQTHGANYADLATVTKAVLVIGRCHSLRAGGLNPPAE